MKRVLFTVIALVSAFYSFGQELDEITRPTANSHEHYGWTMAMDETWLAVGSPHSETSAGADAGKVIVYQRNGDSWEQFQVLTDTEGNAFQNFGFSVDLASGVMVVGAIGTFQYGPFTGRAYVYEFDGSTWHLSSQLKAPDGAAGAYFGHDVATNGDRIVVGAIKANGENEQSGVVYDFAKVNDAWTFGARITSTDGEKHDNFGYSVDISADNRVVVGAPNQNDFIDKSGAAYVFEFDGTGYTEVTKLKAFGRTVRDFLGTSVAIHGHDVVAGAFLADGYSNNTGMVSFFSDESGSWKEVQQLAHEQSELNDYFGRTLALSLNRLFIGAPKANGASGNDVGRGYYYEKDNNSWVLRQVLEDPEADSHNYFGASVALSDFGLAVSARMDDRHNTDGGAVYTADLGVVTGLEDPVQLDKSIELVNYPNPTQQEVNIRYRLVKASTVAVEVFDSNGQPIKALLEEGIQQAGDQYLRWDLTSVGGHQVPNGLYLYRLSIDGHMITRKIVVSR